MHFNADVLSTLDLVQWPHWVCWKYEQRVGEPKPTKPPRNAHTGAYASSTAPSTSVTFDAAGRAELEGWGVGFVFHAELNPFAGIDQDGCRDPHTGVLAEWAAKNVTAFDSYTETSPSGCGCKTIVRGKPRRNGKKKGDGDSAVEVYGRDRFFTLTGMQTSPDTDIAIRQRTLDALCNRLWPVAPVVVQPSRLRRPITASNATLIAKARSAKNGALFDLLWSGAWQGRYGSQSEADAALCRILAFWCDFDTDRVDHLFRQSGLYREKWNRADYRAWTLTFACTQGHA